ncbi:hypothetical protein, partial [Klebsiella pneumoniae]|uniref:hypothetical protein n=1 Tax=Klebsiella pneumoniae TaxID=573 RepID=UPI003EDEC17C
LSVRKLKKTVLFLLCNESSSLSKFCITFPKVRFRLFIIQSISNGISSSNSVGVVFGNTMQLSKDRNINYRKKAETVLSKQY